MEHVPCHALNPETASWRARNKERRSVLVDRAEPRLVASERIRIFPWISSRTRIGLSPTVKSYVFIRQTHIHSTSQTTLNHTLGQDCGMQICAELDRIAIDKLRLLRDGACEEVQLQIQEGLNNVSKSFEGFVVIQGDQAMTG